MSAFWFGDHQGEEIEDVETSYLKWALGNIDVPKPGDERRSAVQDFLSEIEDELARREEEGEDE